MVVTVVERSNGGPSEGKEYILSVYRPGANGSGDVDLDVLDSRYVVKTGDTISGDLTVDGNALFKNTSDFYLPRKQGHGRGFSVLGTDDNGSSGSNDSYYQHRTGIIY